MTRLHLLAWAAVSGTSVCALVACAMGEEPACVDTQALTEPLIKVCSNSTTLVEGLDVSKWQASIDWSQVKAQGYQFAFIRASDGLNYPDGQFEANWKGTKQNGILRGVYQFFRPGQDPKAQADLMLQKLADAGWIEAGDLPAVIDIEVSDGQSDATLRNKALTWLGYVEQKTGKKPIVYTSAAWSSVLGSSFAQYPLWVANYTGSYQGYCPLMPDGWSNWTFWQFTSKGPVAGVGSKDVDKNVFDGSLSALVQFAQSGVVPPPAPKPDAGSDPCALASSGNGPYCGQSLGADPGTLYNCQNGTTTGSTLCPKGCTVMPPGQADTCASGSTDPCASAASGNGPYCGKTLGGDPGTLYDCQSGTTASSAPCPHGCILNPPGTADECAPAPPPPTGAGGSGTAGASSGGSAGSSGGTGSGGAAGWSGNGAGIGGAAGDQAMGADKGC
ncbi:MAG: GH25 family lysozyme [Polyangiaceae bacterium]